MSQDAHDDEDIEVEVTKSRTLRMSVQAEEANTKLLRSKTGGEGGLLGSMAYSYGTFGKDTVHGRLFELETYIFVLKRHMHMYYVFVLLASLFWPIMWVIAIPIGWYGRVCKSKSLVMFSVFAALGLILGLTMWMLPCFATLLGGGPGKMIQLVHRKELNYLDFVDFSTCKSMLLLFIAFVWVYHEVDRDVTQNKAHALESWRYRRHRDWGMECKLHAEQRRSIEHLIDVELPTPGNTPSVSSTSDFDVQAHAPTKENSVYIEELVTVLDQLPGWKSNLDAMSEEFYHYEDGAESMFEVLSKNLGESKEFGVWPLDLFMVKNQYTTNIDLFTALYVSWKQCLDMIWYLKNSYFDNPILGCVCVTLALVRSLIARFWLWLVLNGKFWPQDVAGSMVVLLSTLTSFLVGLLWLSLTTMMVAEYRRTLIQVTILSALADPESRMHYIDYYLNREYSLDETQIARLLSFLPVLSLKFPSNVAAFWRLREYTTFDRSNERIAIEFILEALIIWLSLKFFMTCACLYMSSEMPAVVAVTLFDLAVFGVLLLYSLHVALQINFRMDKHKRIFVEAKYQVTLTEQNMLHAKGGPSNNTELIRDMKVARQLLVEYLNMALEYDRQDKILLGFIVTPGKILSVVASVGGAIVTLILNMEKKGQLNIPDHSKVFGGATDLFLFMHNASAFLPNHFHL